MMYTLVYKNTEGLTEIFVSSIKTSNFSYLQDNKNVTSMSDLPLAIDSTLLYDLPV